MKRKRVFFMKKWLSILLSALLVMSGTLVGFAEDHMCEFVEQLSVDVALTEYSHTNQMTEPNPMTGEYDNGYISITPLGGNMIKVYYHTPFVVMNDEGEPEEWLLNSFYYKASTYVFKVTLGTPLEAGQCSEFMLGSVEVVRGSGRNQRVTLFTPAISHVTTFDTNFEPPLTVYGLISGAKLDSDYNEIMDVSFDFEIYQVIGEGDDQEEVLFATAYSEIGTGTLKFMYDGQLTEYDDLEMPLGFYKLYEVDIPDQYAFVEIIFVENGMPSEPQVNGALFEISSSDQIINLLIVNELKTTDIMAFKFNSGADGVDVPFENVAFDFLVLDKDDVVIAKGQSDDEGEVTFYTEWNDEGFIGLGTKTLNLVYGSYKIQEINIPEAYHFTSYSVQIDDLPPSLSLPGDQPSIEFEAGDAETIVFKFYNEMKYSLIRAYKFNGMAEEDVPFAVPFYFVVMSGENKVADGKSDEYGKVMFYENGFDEPGTDTLQLMYGDYKIAEITPLAPYEFMYYKVYEDEEWKYTSDMNVVPEIMFSAGTVNIFEFVFYNKEVTEPTSDTAYAYPGYVMIEVDDGEVPMFRGGTLNSVLNSNNWGWYIYAQEGVFDVYAAAGGNDIGNGYKVGTVEFKIEDGKYVYDLHLTGDYYIVESPHFGVFANLSDIPNGFQPQSFNNNLDAAEANYLVFHAVVYKP